MFQTKKMFLLAMVIGIFVIGPVATALAAWGDKELETETLAVTFAREVARGGYSIISHGRTKKMD